MKIFLTCLLALFGLQLTSQSSLIDNMEDIKGYQVSRDLHTVSYILLDEKSDLKSGNSEDVISELFEIEKNELEFSKRTAINSNLEIDRYTRFINEIPIVHGAYTVLRNETGIVSIHSEHYLEEEVVHFHNLEESEALSFALLAMPSEMYSWESTLSLMKEYPINSPMYDLLQEVLKQDYPRGELVYVKDYLSKSPKLELAYLFTIESVQPEYRDRVYISARDGRILLRDPQQKHGVGDTRYSGNRNFPTTEISGPPGALYELKGAETMSGVVCETRSLEGLGGLPVSTPAIVALSDSIADGDEPDPCLTDGSDTVVEFGDDEWDSNEHRKVPFIVEGGSCCLAYSAGICDEVKNDDIALDAHWGASIVARYWKDIHNRVGYDDAGAEIKSFVHHGLSHENASWNGMIMKYGDGAYQDGTNPGGMFKPLVSLDVCAHEIGHALCTSTSDLVYVGESGAMNEGLSDIWAAAIEKYVLDSIDGSLNYLTWGIGEQIDERDGGLFNESGARALRWMDHPPAENNPDTYGAGTWWQDPDCVSPNAANDFCGVHFNSGVLNKWFYLLTEGSGNALSPGLNKPAFDDEINDLGNVYSVSGIGFRKAEKIVYGANLLLLPNSRFADMRKASIDIARALYGPCSNEVEQTIKAWYAVGVGPNFSTCNPTIEFNQFNLELVNEKSEVLGCTATKEISFTIFSYMGADTVHFTTSGNAAEGEDFELCVNSLSFIGDEEKELKIIIYDDKVIETNDTLIIHLSGGGYLDADTLIIIDDDGIPSVGGIDTIYSETFDVNDNSWQQELVNPTSLLNEWYIDAFDSNQAHISYQPNTGVSTYFQLVESHIRLKSPMIDALGRKNIEVSFNYQVGGERDLVDPQAIFDFGTFEISYDGFEWEEIDVFVGIEQAGAIVPDSGLYQVMLPQLDNSTFYLGYTWHNDALNGSAFSFMFDNVVIKGEGLEIESDVGDEMETHVIEGEEIAFVSNNDDEIIAIINDASSNMGCTVISISENDDTNDFIPSVCNLRSTKVFNLETENYTDSLFITLFFKESEIDDWSDISTLNVLAVEDVNVGNESSGYEIIDNELITIDDQTNGIDGYASFSFWISSAVRSLALTNRSSTPLVHIVMNTSNNDPFSFRALVEESCPLDTIRFDSLLNGNSINLSSGVVHVGKNLVIEGNGMDSTILHSPSDTCIHVFENTEVTLRNISIKAGPSFPSLYNRGVIMLRDSVGLGQ